jgi:GTPase SAR1 family protein
MIPHEETYKRSIQAPSDSKVELELIDVGGGSNYLDQRIEKYNSSVDLIAVCFAMNDYQSLRNVGKIWLPELEKYCPDKPRILIGCKANKPGVCSRESIDLVQGFGQFKSFIECT